MNFKIKYMHIEGFERYSEMEELMIDQAVATVDSMGGGDSCELYIDDGIGETPNIGLIFRNGRYTGYGLGGDDLLSAFFEEHLKVGDGPGKLREVLIKASNMGRGMDPTDIVRLAQSVARESQRKGEEPMGKRVEMVKDGKTVLVDIVTGEVEEKVKPYEVAVRQFGKCMMASLQYNDPLFAFEARRLTDLPLGVMFEEMDNLQRAIRLVVNEVGAFVEKPLRDLIEEMKVSHDCALNNVKAERNDYLYKLEDNLRRVKADLQGWSSEKDALKGELKKADGRLLESDRLAHGYERDLDSRQRTIVMLETKIKDLEHLRCVDEASFAKLGDLIGRLNVQISDLKKEVIELPELKEKYEEKKIELEMAISSVDDMVLGYHTEQERAASLESQLVLHTDAHNRKNDEIGRLQDIIKWQTKLGLGMGGVFVTTFIERCFGLVAMFFG